MKSTGSLKKESFLYCTRNTAQLLSEQIWYLSDTLNGVHLLSGKEESFLSNKFNRVYVLSEKEESFLYRYAQQSPRAL
jgi:hypothetical protein